MTDTLTGLDSRHNLHLALPDYAAQAAFDRPLTLLLLHVRDFPLWQGQLTPLAADRLLTLTAAVLKRHLPAEAMAVRWDNATFAMLLPHCPLWQAEEIGEMLRHALRQAPLPAIFSGQNLTLDFSYGAAAMPPHDVNSLTREAEEQLERAEGGMFTRLLLKERTGIDQAAAEAYIHLAESFLAHGDAYLRRHGQMTAGYALAVGHRLGMDSGQLAELGMAAAFADLAMPEAAGQALHKPGALTLSEYNRIKKHPEFAAKLCRTLGLSEGVIQSVRWHHEVMDGSGYPDGLSGAGIPLAASVLGACGAYAAMLLPRPYRPARKLYQVKAEIAEAAGRLWPAAVVREVLCL